MFAWLNDNIEGLSGMASWRPGPRWISTQFCLAGQTWELSSVSWGLQALRGVAVCGLEAVWEMWAARCWLCQRCSLSVCAAMGRNSPAGLSPAYFSGRYCLLEWPEYPTEVKWHISLWPISWLSCASPSFNFLICKNRWWSQQLKLGCRIKETLYMQILNLGPGMMSAPASGGDISGVIGA